MTKENPNILKSFIKSVDQLGLTPQFLIGHKSKYNTISGGLLSILIYILSVLACFFFGRELYLKRDPTVILSNFFENDPRVFNLTQNNFNFFVGIQGTDFEYYIDPSIYTLKIGINQMTSKLNSENKVETKFDAKYYNMEKCNLKKHFKNFMDLFKEQDLDNLLCFNSDIQDIIQIAGSFGNENFQFVEFTVSNCKNGTEPDIICKSKEEINKKLAGGFFVVNYIETIFDPKNYTNPNVYIKRNFYTSMSNKFFKEITFNFKNIDYVSDGGILLNSEETKNFIQTDNIKEIYDLREADTFISAVYRLSYNRDVIKRRYLKLQDVIAQVGGFIKGITMIIAILNHFYSTTNFYIFLMNKLYFFKNDSFSNFDVNIMYPYQNNNSEMVFIKKKNISSGNMKNDLLNNKNIFFYNNIKRIGTNPNINLNSNIQKGSVMKINSSHIKNPSAYLEEKQINNNLNSNNGNFNINSNNNLNDDRLISDIISNTPDAILRKIEGKNDKTNNMHYNFSEKLCLILGLCFPFDNKNLKNKKRRIFQISIELIRDRFDAFKYLQVFDEMDVIKHILFEDEQINIINLISNSKKKFIFGEEIQKEIYEISLKKIAESNFKTDLNIKKILKRMEYI